jgi:lactate dehydrogenase-like 2-hydroxyacid dehydrogenase
MKYNKIIGIDPDIDKSGVAIYVRNDKSLILDNWTLSELIKRFNYFAKERVLFVVEAGYLNKSNWHIKKTSSVVAGEIGRRTGENHATAKQIVNIIKEFGFDCVELPPIAKVWKKGKISHKEFIDKCKKEGVIINVGRTNQEVRDAGLIALAYDKRLKFDEK